MGWKTKNYYLSMWPSCTLNGRVWNYKQRRSCPYAYHDRMQGNGSSSLFMLNHDITRTWFFYFHSPATLPAVREPSGPSKHEVKSAHSGEGLGPFRFDVWIAAYASDMFFRNVRPPHNFTSQKKESSAIRLWKYLLPIGNLNANSTMSSIYPSICFTKVYCGNVSNVKLLNIINNPGIMFMPRINPNTSNETLALRFIWIHLMTYFIYSKEKWWIKTHYSCFLSPHIVLVL
jgi:hypothetical protein